MDKENNAEQVVRPLYQKEKTDDISVSRYGKTRYWAVWINDDLLAVTVYKKGAITIRDKLFSIKLGVSNPNRGCHRTFLLLTTASI